MTIADALHELGVRPDTLTLAEKEALDDQGFLHLHGVLPVAQARRMREIIYELFAASLAAKPDGGAELQQIQNLSDQFDICFTHPRVLAAVAHVLRGEPVSQGVHSRPNPPGKGRQGMHQDGPVVAPGEYVTCNSMWPLADFTVENGATRVVPGSHRWNKAPETVMADLNEPHPEEVRLIAPVGTVVIFNGHLWHSATQNNSKADRPNVTSFWGRRGSKHFDAKLTPTARERVGAAARELFPG